ncbi:MAG: (2Fe-2S)-binding protein [Thermoanaerobacteraceae bacterium]|nr:(2Fe-2S)-binding protein [Thermoanaerobacteraceae bacterium]
MKEINISLKVNGKQYDLSVRPNMTLLEVIRDELKLTGTKESCGMGECGACTVIMNGRTVDSCLVLAPQADGAEITTIEGIGEKGLHPVQKAFIDEWAIQCGYCTPGMVMSTVYLLDKNPKPTEDEIKEGLSGNLCRCTGYAKIIKAVQKASKMMQ